MKWAIGDRLFELTSKAGGSVHKTAEESVEQKGFNSELYFVKSQRHVMDTADENQLAAKDVTVVYLSFTHIRISITLPGGSVSLEGGARYGRN